MEFFDINEEFLDNEEYIDTLFSVQMAIINSYYVEVAYDKNEKELSSNPFHPSIYEVKNILDRRIREFEDNFKHNEKWQNYLKTRESITEDSEDLPQALQLFRKLELDDFSKGILILSLMTSFDREIEVIMKYFSGKYENSFPTLELYYKMFYSGSHLSQVEKYDVLSHAKKKLSTLFYELKTSDYPFNEPLIPDKRLISVVLGDGETFADFVLEQKEKDVNELYFLENEQDKIEKFLSKNGENGILIYGEEGSGKKSLISECAENLDMNIVFIELETQDENEQKLTLENDKRVFFGAREALMLDTVPCIVGAEKFSGKVLQEVIDLLKETKKIFVCISNSEEMPKGLSNIMFMELKVLSDFKRREIWERFSEDYNIADDVNFTFLANTFLFTAGRIKNVLALASLDSGDTELPITKDALYKASYALIDHKLSEKAKRVSSIFTWEDLKLPQREKVVLRDLCNRVKNKHIVMTEWEFDKKLPYGSGISAVFAGPPGTGKTMAANVIANELNMQMYQIDLSQVVDKYIGETEKNIKLIFEQARKSNSILFFDEADSLFAKRVESKSSNDRFANIESSMLLQSVEQYPGISILATNNYSSIDPAFIRRLKYLVNFTLPDVKTRLEIWNSVFPSKVPISDEVSLEFFAKQFEFSGAYIKNIAVSATYIAAEEGEEVNNFHLFTAISREMNKEGRKLDVSQMAQYGYMFEMLQF